MHISENVGEKFCNGWLSSKGVTNKTPKTFYLREDWKIDSKQF